MTIHYVMVAIEYPSGHSNDFVAEQVSYAIEAAINEHSMMTVVGGPNGPIERHPELISVTPELE